MVMFGLGKCIITIECDWCWHPGLIEWVYFRGRMWAGESIKKEKSKLLPTTPQETLIKTLEALYYQLSGEPGFNPDI